MSCNFGGNRASIAIHATYPRRCHPVGEAEGSGAESSHRARCRRPKDNSDQLKSRLCGETRGEREAGWEAADYPRRLPACLPSCPGPSESPSPLAAAATAHSISMHPPFLSTGRSLARRRDHGSVRRPRRRRVSLRCSHNLWGQSAIRFSLTLLPCCCCCSAASGGAARKNKFKVLSPSPSDRTEGKGEWIGVGALGSTTTKLVCPVLWPNKMIF